MFCGSALTAILFVLFYGVMLCCVDKAAGGLSAVVTVSPARRALLWRILLWVVGFWLLPAVTLKVLADLMPTCLSISGWTPAILCGLVIMCIGWLANWLTTSLPMTQR